MRSQYSKDEMLVAVAKKKPRLQALIDQVGQLSLDEINALSEPLWVREGLVILKQSGGRGQKQRLQELLDAADAADAAAALLPPRTYEVRIWDGSEIYLGSNRGDRDWKIQVQTGDSLMIVDDHMVRFGDSVLNVGDYDRQPMMRNSKLVGYMTLSQYCGFHRALLNQRHKNI